MKYWAVTFLLLFNTVAIAQDNNDIAPVVFTHISEENGLSDNHVTSVFKDKSSLLWVGTKDGLNLLDGSTITTFKHSEADSNSICSNHITSIAEDKNGTIWVSTDKSFCRYDKKKKKFFNIKANKTVGDLGSIAGLVIDNRNNLWLGSWRGLLKYNTETEQLSFYPNNDTGFDTDIKQHNRINHLIISTAGIIWLATSDGLWSFSPVDNQFTKRIHQQNDHHYHPLCMYVYEDASNNIWAGFWNTGLKKYNTVTAQLTDYGLTRPSYSISAITAFNNNGKKTIWVNGKLLLFDENSSRYFNFAPPVTEKDFPDVSPLYQSADGWVWLGSDNGLYIYNPQQQVFSHQLFKENITSQSVCLYNYKNGLLVGGQAGSFLKWKNGKGDIIKNYSQLCRNQAAMLCIEKESENEFWIGTTDGVLQTNLETGFAKWRQHKEGDSTSLPRNFVTSILNDSKNNLWVFPWREGIWQMDKKTGKCKKMLDGFINEAGYIKKLLISDAKEDGNGNIWMADLDEGIILYNAKAKKFTKPFIKEIGERTHTSRIFLKKGDFYSATPTMLIRWNENNHAITAFPVPQEFNKGIRDIYPDSSGNWWLSTSNGLLVFNEASQSFRRYTTADGLFRNDINGSLIFTTEQKMIIAAPDYFTSFNPVKFGYTNATRTNIIVTAFIANNQFKDVETNKNISLNYTENNITIKWALPIYNNPLKNQYYYQLNGIDTAWHFSGHKGEVQYANLSPGKYTIQLKATTANETDAASIITIRFTIRPPFWKTGWFLSLSILAAGLLFYAVVRYISQRNLKEKLLRLEKKQAIEKERNRISRDMHDDLGSGLTKIAIMSEVVKKQLSEPEKAKLQLENISQSSRELVDNLQDIIWVLNPKNDTLESLAAYIREYTLKFFEPFNTRVQFQYPDQFAIQKLSEETRRNTFLVIKETLNNIAKHAWCNTVIIGISQNKDNITIHISDDGKGFDPEKTRQFGNGLINIKNRMEQTGGSFHVTSSPGKGTSTTLQLPT